jgi:putative tricarboxylic transport membrane protein
MRQYNYPAAPLVLGIILGDMVDVNLRRALIRTDADITPFFTRPISLILLGITLLVILSRMAWLRRALSVVFRRRRAEATSTEP